MLTKEEQILRDEMYEERAAIMEYDGGLIRHEAETRAYMEMVDIFVLKKW